jgi:hypothetical protein
MCRQGFGWLLTLFSTDANEVSVAGTTQTGVVLISTVLQLHSGLIVQKRFRICMLHLITIFLNIKIWIAAEEFLSMLESVSVIVLCLIV